MAFHVAVAVSPFKYSAKTALSVSEAREEDRGRRRSGDHAGGLGRAEVRRAEALPERARARDAGARQRLRPRPAGRRANGHGQPPGCWAPPALVERSVRRAPRSDGGLRRGSSGGADGGRAQGSRYAGAYIGGTNDAGHVAWIISDPRSSRPAGRSWRKSFTTGTPAGTTSMDDDRRRTASPPPPLVAPPPSPVAPPPLVAPPPSPVAPPPLVAPPPSRVTPPPPVATAPLLHPPPTTPSQRAGGERWYPRTLDLMGRLLPVTRDTWLRRVLRALMAWVDRAAGAGSPLSSAPSWR